MPQNKNKKQSFRKVKHRVKTAKGRKTSSTNWIQRHINDEYVMRAKAEGFRSRAAFKLLQIIEKFDIINNNTNSVLDLGCAPGSWLQVLAQKSIPNLFGIDLQDTEHIPNTKILKGDFLDPNIQDQCRKFVDKFDVILSDMAAKACGTPSVDHLRLMELAETVFEFAKENLETGGHLVVKILRGEEEHRFMKLLNTHFKKVKYFKPDASYKDSAEIYVIAEMFKG